MANYQTLKSAIQQVIKTNHNNEISGADLQQALLAMINSLGEGYQFMGVATPTTNPGTLDSRAFYIANGKGTYTSFGDLSVTEDDVVILYWDSSWHKMQTGIASQEKLTDLEREVGKLQQTLNKDGEEITSTNASVSFFIPKDKDVKLRITNNKNEAQYSQFIFYTADGGDVLFNTSTLLWQAKETKVFDIRLVNDATFVKRNIFDMSYTIKVEYGLSYGDVKGIASNLQNVGDIINTELPICAIMKDATISVSHANTSSKTNRGIQVTTLGDGTNANVSFTFNRTPVAIGDFIFLRTILISNVDQWVRISLYSDGLDQRTMDFFLKAGVNREICFRGAVASMAGKANVQIGISNVRNTQSATIEIKDFILCVNHYNAFVDVKTKETLKDYSPQNKIFVVDPNGNGHFYSIANAADYLRNCFDVVNEPYTIFVKNGKYDKEHDSVTSLTYPYAIINKGSNKVSVIGESRDNVIIEWTNTNTCQGKIIEVGSSPCVIENLTINNLKGEDYITDLGRNPYCIHIDLGTARNSKYKTEIYNCYLYSECHSPIGAGVSPYQTISIHDCFIQSASKNGRSAGAVYIHAYAGGISAYDETMSVDIQRNQIVSTDGTKALTIPDVGESSFENIPVIVVGNLLYSNGEAVTDSNFSDKNKVPYCMGNNIESLNTAVSR